MPYFLPATLDLDAHLAAWPPSIPDFRRENLAYVLHLVAYLPLTNRKVAARLQERRGFVPLRAKRLRQWLEDYPDYLRYTLDSGLLETDNFYLEPHRYRKGKCRGYRFAERFRTKVANGASPSLVLHEGAEPAALARAHRRNLLGMKKALRDQGLERADSYCALIDWLDEERTPIRIDRAAAERYVAEQLAKMLANPGLWQRKQERKQRRNPGQHTLFKNPEEQALQQRLSIIKIDDRALSANVDRVGRLHSALTNLSSSLRQFVYAEGYSRLVSFDLSCSQPYLANLLLTRELYEAPYSKGRRGSRVPLFLQREGQLGSTTLEEVKGISRHCAEILQRSDIQDVNRFRDVTSQGEFYAYLAQELRRELPAQERNRDALKGLVFQVLFSHNSFQTPEKAAFARLFPTAAAVFAAFKRKDHTVLPLVLQQLEACLFLQKIAGRFIRRYPEVPLFTVHDSVIVPEEYAPCAEQIMVKELTRWVGVKPTIKRTHWGSAPPVD